MAGNFTGLVIWREMYITQYDKLLFISLLFRHQCLEKKMRTFLDTVSAEMSTVLPSIPTLTLAQLAQLREPWSEFVARPGGACAHIHCPSHFSA